MKQTFLTCPTCSEFLLVSQTASFTLLLRVELVPVAPAASVPEAVALSLRRIVEPFQHEVEARARVLIKLANV